MFCLSVTPELSRKRHATLCHALAGGYSMRTIICSCVQVQTIGFLSHLRSNGNLGPFMVVGPLSTLPNWVSEFERWCPSMPVVLYHGNKQERALLRAQHMPLGGWACVRLWSHHVTRCICHTLFMSHHLHVTPCSHRTLFMSHPVHVTPCSCHTLHLVSYATHVSVFSCVCITSTRDHRRQYAESRHLELLPHLLLSQDRHASTQ